MFVIASSRSEKTNYLLNLTHQQLDTNKTHPHAKDFYEWMYQYLTTEPAQKWNMFNGKPNYRGRN